MDTSTDIRLVMSVIDEMVDGGLHLVREPRVLKSDQWTDGYGGSSGDGRKISINFGLTVTKPTRSEVQDRVEQILMKFHQNTDL